MFILFYKVKTPINQEPLPIPGIHKNKKSYTISNEPLILESSSEKTIFIAQDYKSLATIISEGMYFIQDEDDDDLEYEYGHTKTYIEKRYRKVLFGNDNISIPDALDIIANRFYVEELSSKQLFNLRETYEYEIEFDADYNNHVESFVNTVINSEPLNMK